MLAALLVCLLALLIFTLKVKLKPSIMPDLSDTYYKRGIAFLKKGDFDNGIAALTKALQLNPNNTRALHLKAIVEDIIAIGKGEGIIFVGEEEDP